MARDLAIDLGTANTLVYMKGKGIVLNEPSVIAMNRQTGEVLATGHEAWQMIGRTPGYIVAVRPLRGGAITDFDVTERMIRLLLQRVGVSRFTRPKVVICVPSAITEVERRAVTDAARRTGAADAQLIEQPMAAAIGAQLPIDEPIGNMIIDIAGDTTIDQFNVDPDGTFIMSSRQTLLTLKQPFPNHNGGDLLLSPDGRALLVFTGDGGAGGDPLRAALDLKSYLGKILMIDLTVPAQDPTTSAKVLAVGLRNPWRVSYDSVSGNLWIADVGQNLWEEINVLPYASTEGVSFGWSAIEATHLYNADQEAINNTFTQIAPIYEYEHVDNNCSISGGAVYRGTQVASVGTWYIFSDYCSGNVQALCVTDELTSCGILSLGTVPQAVAVMPDANGELWVLSLSGEAVPITKKS